MSSVAIPIQGADASSMSVGSASSTLRRTLFPIYIVMTGRIAPDWELIKPLDLAVERETDGSYLVSDDIFNVFGQGVTATNAVFDYFASLREYYRLLSRHDDGPTQGLLEHLQQYLRSVSR